MPDWRMLRSRTKGVPSTSGDPQPPRREFSTRLFGKSKNRGKGNAQSSLDQNSLGETKYQVFGSLVPESVEETGGGEGSASTKNPRDNDSVPFATSQTLVSTPPTMEDIDRWTYHTDLQNFGQNLQIAANAVFPNDKTSRYEKVSVLMLSWADEDPKLPVSLEVESLASVFQHRYNYNVEQWRIPEENCHFELAAKVMTFVEPESDSKSHLKIVYYAGHARLLDTRALALTSWRNIKNYRRPIVKWGAIQSFIEESPNDTLILLDCCASGIANTSEGSGVTEIITACAWNQIANGVGEYSLTNALTIELERLSSRRFFSVGELYRNVFLRTQSRLPTARAEDGRDWERHPAPIHLVLTQDSLRPRSIQLSVLSLPPPIGIRVRLSQADFDGSEPKSSHQPLTPEAVSPIFPGSTHDETPSPDYRIPRDKFPRLAFAIRLRETLSPSAYNQNLFTAWLKDMPAIAEEVKVEAGFDSFSTLLIVSIPFALSAYMPSDAAVVSLGPISSENKIILSPARPDPDLSTKNINSTFGLFRRPRDRTVSFTSSMLEPLEIRDKIPEMGQTNKEEKPSRGIHGM